MAVAEPKVNRRRRKTPATETAAPEATVAQNEFPEFVEDVRDEEPAGTAGDGRALARSDNEPPQEDEEPVGENVHGVAREQLRSFVERIERLEEEKKTVADDIKDVYGELKGVGFDPKIVRKIIQLRKQDADERAEQEAILDTYKMALGMIAQDSEDDA